MTNDSIGAACARLNDLEKLLPLGDGIVAGIDDVNVGAQALRGLSRQNRLQLLIAVFSCFSSRRTTNRRHRPAVRLRRARLACVTGLLPVNSTASRPSLASRLAGGVACLGNRAAGPTASPKVRCRVAHSAFCDGLAFISSKFEASIAAVPRPDEHNNDRHPDPKSSRCAQPKPQQKAQRAMAPEQCHGKRRDHHECDE